MRQRGFTLLEIIVAVGIFSIISLVISTVLYVIINAQQNIQDSTESLAQLQIAMSLIEQDISQITLQNYQTPNGRTRGPIDAQEETLSFTTASYLNPDARFNRSELIRVHYETQNDQLVRITHALNNESEQQQRVLLKDVKNLKFRYLSQRNRWLPRMGSYMVSFVSDSTVRLLPKAVEMQLEIKTWGKIELFCLLGVSEHET